MTKKEKQLLDLKINFNTIAMRELGLDYNEEDGYVYRYPDDDNGVAELLQIKEKFIKYSEDQYPVVAHNEIDLNLIENPRLMEYLVYKYLQDNITNEIVSVEIVQAPEGGGLCYAVLSFKADNEIRSIKSDIFVNEAVCLFNLICKIKKTTMLYRGYINDFDVIIERNNK